MPILDIPATFDDDIRMRFKEAEDLFPRRHFFSMEDTAFRLFDYPFDQHAIVLHFRQPGCEVAGSTSKPANAW